MAQQICIWMSQENIFMKLFYLGGLKFFVVFTKN